ncbi:MAG: NUMOD1 domain-containing DNA-binding protein [bacterium]
MKKRKGYWLGKKKDQHTLDRLSESKFKKVIQYDMNGNLIKEWPSIKCVAVNVFDDYRIVNGGSKSKIYSLLKNTRLRNKSAFNSYWFLADDLLKMYDDKIPNKLDIKKINDDYKQKLIESRKGKSLYIKCYTIITYNDDGLYEKFDNINEASEKLKLSTSHIGKCCRHKLKLPNGNFVKYGEKTVSFVKKYK